jgi:penicillin amidase
MARDLGLALGPLADDPVHESESSYLASNNWAVSPERSAAGYALLAGDPHLELTLPSIWYEAHLVVPGVLDAYGVTIPSVPVIIIGFNRDVAWSFTNTGADVIDYYEEELDVPAGEDLEQPTHYRVDGEWRPLEQRVEEYSGRRGKLLGVDTIRFTHRGPVSRRGDRWLSMRWTVLERGAETDALWAAARASSSARFDAGSPRRRALRAAIRYAL